MNECIEMYIDNTVLMYHIAWLGFDMCIWMLNDLLNIV